MLKRINSIKILSATNQKIKEQMYIEKDSKKHGRSGKMEQETHSFGLFCIATGVSINNVPKTHIHF